MPGLSVALRPVIGVMLNNINVLSGKTGSFAAAWRQVSNVGVFRPSRAVILGALLGAGSAGAFLLGVEAASFLFLGLAVLLPRRPLPPERSLGAWGASYALISSFWAIAALGSIFWVAASSVLVAGLGAVVYGLPALVLRSRRYGLAWPLLVAALEALLAALGISLAPIGLWANTSVFGFLTTLGSVYFATVGIVLVAQMMIWWSPKPVLAIIAVASLLHLSSGPVLPALPDLDIRTISLNPDAAAKWTPVGSRALLSELIEQSRAGTDADLIIWPENALTTTFDLDRALEQVSAIDTPLLFGMTRYARPGQPELVNSAVLVEDGAVSVSNKTVLVPFYERGLGSGERTVLALANGTRILPLICYEAAFAIPPAQQIGADLIVVLAAETGFSRPMAARVMGANAVARALETGLPVLRVSDADR